MEIVILLLVAGLALILSIAAFARHAKTSEEFDALKGALDEAKDNANAALKCAKATESLSSNASYANAGVQARQDAELGKLRARVTALETPHRTPEPQKPKGRKHS